MNISNELIVNEAVKRLQITTGFNEETGSSPAYYFAEIEALGIKCSDFSEEAAVKLVTEEAAIVLSQKLSLAKRILKKNP